MRKAEKLVQILNAISLVVAIPIIVIPKCHPVQIILCSLIPIIGLIAYKIFKGLTTFEYNPNLVITLLVPALALSFKAILYYTIFDYSNFWKPALAISLLIGFFSEGQLLTKKL